MDNPIIVTTPAQLREIITEQIETILPRLADFRHKNEAVETDGLTHEEAARFLTEQGIPTTRASLYNLVYKNAVPYRKFKRRTIFSKKELLAWIDENSRRSTESSVEATIRIAKQINSRQ